MPVKITAENNGSQFFTNGFPGLRIPSLEKNYRVAVVGSNFKTRYKK
jgi:hypothetical protein